MKAVSINFAHVLSDGEILHLAISIEESDAGAAVAIRSNGRVLRIPEEIWDDIHEAGCKLKDQ